MRLMLDRVSADWEARYGHPVLLVETFVDPAQFSGTIYRAGGWVELGQTSGWGRCGRDYYVKHNRPKRLDVTANEDRCRVRTPNAVWILGMFRRLAISLLNGARLIQSASGLR